MRRIIRFLFYFGGIITLYYYCSILFHKIWNENFTGNHFYEIINNFEINISTVVNVDIPESNHAHYIKFSANSRLDNLHLRIVIQKIINRYTNTKILSSNDTYMWIMSSIQIHIHMCFNINWSMPPYWGPTWNQYFSRCLHNFFAGMECRYFL